MRCEKRGCRNEAAVLGGVKQLTRCVDCLTGKKRADRITAITAGVVSLPPLVEATETTFGFRSPGTPLGINRIIQRGRWSRKTERGKQWIEVVKSYAREAVPLDWCKAGKFNVDIHCVFSNPQSDRDGPIKYVQDALNGIAYFDDNQIVSGETRKSVDPAQPRLEVVVRRLE